MAANSSVNSTRFKKRRDYKHQLTRGISRARCKVDTKVIAEGLSVARAIQLTGDAAMHLGLIGKSPE